MYGKIAELVEVMRQKGDSQLIDLLNKVRIASLNFLFFSMEKTNVQN